MITRDEAKAHLGITDSSQNSLVDILISKATSFLESKIGYKIVRATGAKFYIDADGACKVFFPKIPNVDTETMVVKYNSGTEFDEVWDTIEYKYKDHGELVFKNPVYGDDSIELTVTYGYDTDANRAPANIQTAIYSLVSYGYSMFGEISDVRAETVDGDRTEFLKKGEIYGGEIPYDAQEIIDNIKDYGIYS